MKNTIVYGDAQLVHMGEVKLAQLFWFINLAKKYFFGRTFCCTLIFDPPLQGPQLTIGKSAWLFLLKILKNGFGLQPRIY